MPTLPHGARPASRTAAPTAPRTLRRRARAAAALACAALLAGCGVRLDTPPPGAPSPDAIEALRQDEAVNAATIAQTVSQITAADPAVSAQLQAAAADAGAHAEALGGVWVAWPEGAPTGVATPEVSTAAPVAEPGALDVLTLLRDGAASARTGALQADDDALAAALLAVSISRGQGAAGLSAALGKDDTASAGSPLTAEDLLEHGAGGPTLLVLDSARFALETVAARSQGVARTTAAGQADHLQDLVDAAIAAGAPDERMGAYDFGAQPGDGGVVDGRAPAADGAGRGAVAAAGGVDLTPEQTLAVAAQERLLEHWTHVAAGAGPGIREPLVAAAEDAATQVRAWGGTLPAMPGLG